MLLTDGGTDAVQLFGIPTTRAQHCYHLCHEQVYTDAVHVLRWRSAPRDGTALGLFPMLQTHVCTTGTSELAIDRGGNTQHIQQ